MTKSGASGDPEVYHGVPGRSVLCPLPHYPGTTYPVHDATGCVHDVGAARLNGHDRFTRLLLESTVDPANMLIHTDD